MATLGLTSGGANDGTNAEYGIPHALHVSDAGDEIPDALHVSAKDDVTAGDGPAATCAWQGVRPDVPADDDQTPSGRGGDGQD
jgi:hypothetical protein